MARRVQVDVWHPGAANELGPSLAQGVRVVRPSSLVARHIVTLAVCSTECETFFRKRCWEKDFFLASGVVALAAAGLIAAPAHADQYDFISELDSKGVYYRDIIGMMDLGKQTCFNLRTATPLGEILKYLVNQQGFAGYEAATIVAAAATNMCPGTIPYLESQMNAPPPPLKPIGTRWA
jgi:hypothetical protein